ncbi:MAG: formyltransferase family protein [Promethearchaeota archaeon]
MKIIIITQKEPFFIPIVLNSIMKNYKNYLESIVFLKPNEYKHKFNSFFYYLRFWGSWQLLKFGLKYLEIKFKRKLNLNGIEIFENINVNSKDFIEKAKEVDYVISIAANQIFKEKLLKAPKEMCLNIHASLLPKTKGYNPSFWNLYNNETFTGITLHKIIKELDSGPIIIQKKLRIRPNETWYSLQKRITSKASEILVDTLPKLAEKNLNLKDPEGISSLFRRPKVKDGIEFRRRGNRFI